MRSMFSIVATLNWSKMKIDKKNWYIIKVVAEGGKGPNWLARSYFKARQKRKKIQMKEEKNNENWKKSENRYAKTAEQRIFPYKTIPLRIFVLSVDYL